MGVDGSEHSRSALKWAADEAGRRGALLRIMYASISKSKDLPAWYDPDESKLSPAEAIIDDAVGLVATRHPSVLTHGEIVEWPAGLVLTNASKSAELLVIGSRGMGGFKGLLLGSVSDQCVQHAHCPVAVVHADPDELPYRAVEHRIVVGIDGSFGSNRALQWGLEEAGRQSASVEAVFAWQHPSLHHIVVGQSERHRVAADEIVVAASDYAKQQASGVPFTASACLGPTVPTLLDASEGANLLVVGSRGHGEFFGSSLGSVAHQCARHAGCAVVVVRPMIADEPAEVPAQPDLIVRETGRSDRTATLVDGRRTT